jgi:hypothetical protein
MKHIYYSLLLLASSSVFAQNGIFLTEGATWTSTENAVIQTDSIRIESGSMLQANNANLQLKGNFANSGELQSGTSTIIFNGENKQIVRSVNGNFYNITVNKNSDSLLLASNITITNTLAMQQGMIKTRPNDTLILEGSTANVQNEDNDKYVMGRLSVLREVSGNSNIELGNSGVSIHPQGQNLGEVRITRTAGLKQQGTSYGVNPDATTKSIDRIWNIKAENTFATPVDLTLSWLSANDNGLADFTVSQVWKSTNNGSTWFKVGNEVDASGRTITVQATNFSQWTVSNDVNPLPVRWLSFEVKRNEKDAHLIWQTATEKNSAYFIVERSTDGTHFEQIAEVKAAGFSNSLQSYNYTDKSVCENVKGSCGIVYYRIKQIDFDGNFDYSVVRNIYFDGNDFTILSAFPNPFNEQVVIQVLSAVESELNVSLIDELGRTVLQQTTTSNKGQTDVLLNNLHTLPAGIYFCRISNGKELLLQKLVKYH